MPLLDPLNDMKISDSVLQENIIKLQALEKRKDNHPLRYVCLQFNVQTALMLLIFCLMEAVQGEQ